MSPIWPGFDEERHEGYAVDGRPVVVLLDERLTDVDAYERYRRTRRTRLFEIAADIRAVLEVLEQLRQEGADAVP